MKGDPLLKLDFVKMHGAGNDFIMMATTSLPPSGLSAPQITEICRRRLGVGADGMILVGPDSADRDVAFRMTYYNADGGEAEMCGNGARCAVAFARRLELISGACRFSTSAGVLEGDYFEDGTVTVSLPPWRDLELDLAVPGSPFAAHHGCNTGVPHLVVPVDDVDRLDLTKVGPPLRHHQRFAPAGINVNWVDRDPATSEWRLRTYERGVEAETLACGTGAAATAVVLCRLGLADSPVALRTRGGDLLEVGVDGEHLRLHGPAVATYSGEVEIS